jgi:hypothetical protein
MSATSASRSARAACELAELGYRGGLLVVGQVAPLRPVPGLPCELGDEETVVIGAVMILSHSAMIERKYGKHKIARIVSSSCLAGKELSRAWREGCDTGFAQDIKPPVFTQ